MYHSTAQNMAVQKRTPCHVNYEYYNTLSTIREEMQSVVEAETDRAVVWLDDNYTTQTYFSACCTVCCPLSSSVSRLGAMTSHTLR